MKEMEKKEVYYKDLSMKYNNLSKAYKEVVIILGK